MNKNERAKKIANFYWGLCQKRSEKEIDQITTALLDFLASRGKTDLASKVLAETKNILYAQHNQILVQVLSRHDLSNIEQKAIKSLVAKKTAKEPILKTEIDEELIGGVAIKYEDKILDLSIKKQLENLKQFLSS